MPFCLGNCPRKFEGSSFFATGVDFREDKTLATILSSADALFLSIAATNMTNLLF
jgi:hypothetical protein